MQSYHPAAACSIPSDIRRAPDRRAPKPILKFRKILLIIIIVSCSHRVMFISMTAEDARQLIPTQEINTYYLLD